MKIGDLVKPTMSCGGQPGTWRCGSAIIIKVYPEGSAENPYEPGYDCTEYDLMCSCGIWGSLEEHLEAFDELHNS